ncbi:hypothetical protein [Rhizobium sp. NFACC06-2]|uniref:hypothetical protein n=1 Tax=Rhizobium sp. NFACC06-2 TaxID=1566264 RepID=UPI000876FEFB|nr:hypothetical protein [Rhizobium sp. NFACC06-2]SCY85059.1 hypothetical protein SAMN03159288_04682 [Rhizobium sp. NFACC06-2]
MQLAEKIDSLSDEEVLQALNLAVSGVAAHEPELARWKFLSDAWVKLTAELGNTAIARRDDEIGGRPEQAQVARLALKEWARIDELAPRVEAALAQDRKLLIEPVTAALVLAAIVVVLQTQVSFSIEKKNGETSVKFDLSKKATADGIVKRFFGFFS